LLEELPAPDRKRIEKNVSADLTKLDTQQILEHFSE